LETRIQSLEEIVARLGAAQALGAVPTDRVADARAVLEGSRAETPPLALAERNAVRRLATLTGRVPEWGLAAAESWSKDLLVPPQAIAIIDPQTALRHRPDVRAAEARLDAALARAGVARADLYPRVTLLGETGRTGAPGELQAASAIRFSYGLSLSWGVFDLESTRARIAAADAGADAALATWESVTLAALEEADGALDALTATRQVENAATRAAAAAQEGWLAAHARFVAGEASAVDLARAELVRLETAGRATTARADVARAWIGAHLALGAGWRDAG
jgi:outer membrane protein TolC